MWDIYARMGGIGRVSGGTDPEGNLGFVGGRMVGDLTHELGLLEG